MQKAWTNFAWVNLPSTDTALEADRLNTMNSALETIDNRVVTFDTTKANQTDLLQAVKTITFNDQTGVFTITFFNGATVTIDTDIEKIAVNFDYDDDPTSAHYQSLIITLDDGTVKYVDLSALITQFEFVDTATIAFSVDLSGNVSAIVKDGSITGAKLEPNYLANIQIEVGKAETASETSEAWATGKRDGTDVPSTDPTYHNNSKYYSEQADALGQAQAQNSEAWAVGQRGGVDVPVTDDTYHNNSKYYAGHSESSAQDAQQAKADAEDILDEVIAVAGEVVFTVNYTTGDLEYTDNVPYTFTINTTTGNLEWEVVTV